MGNHSLEHRALNGKLRPAKLPAHMTCMQQIVQTRLVENSIRLAMPPIARFTAGCPTAGGSCPKAQHALLT